MNRYRLIYTLLLTALMASMNASAGVTIHGHVFGGGNDAAVETNTTVNIGDGQIDGNVYGGGNLGSVGTYDTSSDMKTFVFTANTGTCNVTIFGGTIGTGVAMSADGTFANGNVYGAGKGEADTYWCEKAMAYKTNVIINAGTVNGTVYGGGQIGRVENDATVIIGVESPANNTVAPNIIGNVFGAGAGLKTHGYSALLRGDTKVTIQGNAHIGLNVYGGGEKASVGRFVIKGGLPSEPADDGSGDCIVNVQGTAIIGTNTDNNITDKGNVYGTCQGVTPPTSSEFTAYNTNYTSMQAVAQKAPEGTQGTAWAYVDGSDNKYYWVYYETLDAYKEFLNTLALASHPVVTIGGILANETTGAVTPSGNPTVNGSVFGGGQRGITLGTVAVNIAGGTIYDDVYGGGALADTNKGNQTAEKYDIATVTEGETDVAGMYELIDDEYTLTEDTKAVESKTYYTKAAQSSINTTTVNLTGGYIKGDAYGGGLGQKADFNGASSDIAATVWGDIYVTLNGTKFDINYYDETGYTDVVTSGRVFGCNNLNGSPKGDVTVTVNQTVAGNTHRTESSPVDKRKSETESDHSYELAAVYGGGNLAPFTTSGKKTHVIIRGCSDTSIETVYGGGNAAPVPETAVDIYSCYEIGSVFGGGNGKDKYKNDNGWQDNPGANVNGPTTTWIYGGTVHEAYGASNKKGTITGTVLIDVANTNPDNCTLDVAKIVGAGKDADVNGDLIMVMGCKPGTKVPVLYAGADNAHVNGNVELTITSGKFGQVFGGNNAGGYILGHIKLNIEETGDCATPIEIDELYLGGNQAAYSQYGYYNAETDPTKAPNYQPRTAEMADAESSDFKSPIGEIAGMTVRKEAPYGQPELNIISCTYIGQVFGGGYGTGASLYGNPKVNINMIPGSKASGVPAVMTAKGLTSSENPNNLGIIGTVYGGGNAADVIGDPTVNIGTLQTVDLVSTGVTGNTVVGAYISGNVFGGGKGEAKTTEGTEGEAFLCAKAMVKGDVGTHVNIGNGFVRGNVYGGGEVGRVEHNTAVKIGLDAADVPTGKTSAPTIKGNVFGAGKGVNTHGYSALVRGNSTVTVQADSKVESSVYGGGEMASVGKYRVENGLPVALAPDNEHPNSGYCYVYIRGNAEIGPNDMEMTKEGGPSDAGHVFGAGKGVLPYEGYTAANAQPFHMNGTQHKVNNVWDGKSWDDAQTWYDAYDPDAELDADYVKFIKSLALATQTVVDISGNPFIKGSVYGGSENGFVQKDTHVTISGGQIGNGYVQMDDDGNYLATKVSVNRRYTTTEWSNGALDVTNDRDELKNAVANTYYKSSLPECASWPYGQAANAANRYAPYDREALSTGYYDAGGTKSTEGGRPDGDDGHTFYGNVFAGGSGYYPYKPGRWFEDAGAVYGNTYLTISGGHILTSVYGGNEMTDVGTYDGTDKLKLTSGGTCTITMTGGTIGVPRTLKQIEKHPVTCYLFGAGKGDQRVFFNKSTNIGNAVINISEDARIYGSIFGGGEDGHVMKNVTMNILAGPTKTEGDEQIQYPYIGTWGTSYVDGNVFGGGRGFGGDAYTAGNVAGTVTMKIEGGTMLGSIYGGGRLGSVGYGLFDASVTDYYGKMRPDDTTESFAGVSSSTTEDFPRGYVYMTIGKDDGTGPTIGNKWEYKVPSASNGPTNNNEPTLPANISNWSTTPGGDWDQWKEYNHVPKTLFDTSNGRLLHTKGGNVFAGGMGRREQLDGVTPIPAPVGNTGIDWHKLGNVKSTTLTIKGGTIKSCVYGGGELGAVQEHHTTNDINMGTEVIIQGTSTTIGSEVMDGSAVKYTFGSVYGGGYGTEADVNDTYITDVNTLAGLVWESTNVNMTAGHVWGSVFGGGEMACVGGNTTVAISGGEIGKGEVQGSTDPIPNYVKYGGATMGNVFGGGKGSENAVISGLVKGNTNVTISSSSTDTDGKQLPKIYHNVYGGGALGSVGTFSLATSSDNEVNHVSVGTPISWTAGGTSTVTITGGTIGITGWDNGMVNGASRGGEGDPSTTIVDRLAWVKTTNVTIGTSSGGPYITGSVYGGGENGHNSENSTVTVNGGTIGYTSYNFATNSYECGNVYGSGCGTDKYDTNNDGTGDTYNPMAGIVRGTTTVNVTGGTVRHNVYGAGSMASVGTMTTDNTGAVTIHSGGTTNVTVSGGTVGVDGNKNGDVFGAARGDKTTTENNLALVKETNVVVSGSTSTTQINGNVYGGGEVGNVHTNTRVNVQGGAIAKNVFGGGKGSDHNFTCDKAMVGVNDEGKDVSNPGDNEYKDKGTIVTISNGTIGTLGTNNQLAENTGNVYGGGEIGRVEWNTQVKIGIGEGEGTFAPIIYGNVYGAGKGLATHGYSALVRGNCTVTVQGGAKVGHNVYGGGENSTAGRYWVKNINNIDAQKKPIPGAPTPPDDLPDGMPYKQQSGGICSVTIQGEAEIGYNGAAADAGHVYGAGKGVKPSFTLGTTDRMVNDANGGSYVAFEDERDKVTNEVVKTAEELYLEFLQTLALATNSSVTIGESAQVKGSVFGGSESGFVQHDTNVTINNGTIGTTASYGNVFGGGRGLEEFAEAGKVKGNTRVTINNGTMYGNVYGGGNLGDVGLITKPADYNYTWKQTDGTTANTSENNNITGTSNNTGICKVIITGGTIGISGVDSQEHGNVFGAGKGTGITWWCEKAIVFATDVKVSGSTVVYGNVYGGGQVGRVEDDGKVTIGTAGSGEGSEPDIKGDVFGAGAGLQTHGYSALLRGNSEVTVQGIAQIGGSVYGGGEIASVGRFTVVKGLPTKPETGGNCTVTIQDNAQIGSSGTDHHVFGACKGVTSTYNQNNYKNFKSMQTEENGAKGTEGADWDYYKSYSSDYEGTKFVWVYYRTETDYLAFLKTLALTSHPNVTIGGTRTWNESTKTESFTPSSGTPSVFGSVYGGGQRGVTLGHVDVNIIGGTVKLDVYGGGALADTNLGNWDVNGYVLAAALNDGESITDLYARTGTEGNYTYTKIKDSETTFASNTYYRQQATWAHDTGSAYYKTTVDLTGGTIDGNVYGGGHGNATTEAEVYGDVEVKLNEAVANDGCKVKGQIFGCNNMNGSPKGGVTVHVYKTVGYDTDHQRSGTKNNTTYEVAAVFGGGNQAAYNPQEPDDAKSVANVIIDGCDQTSIETVYGGGNAASAPATHVTVNGCYEIGTVFGGGYGAGENNPGANVGYKSDGTTPYGLGTTTVDLFGGVVHEAFGSSNTRGIVREEAHVNLDEKKDGNGNVCCPMLLDEVYGGGNEAYMEGGTKVDLGCITKLKTIYGGAKNANVNGDINMTIQSGTYDRVFGGNNVGGTISGTITVNIEETGCHPIIIGQLFGGGNQAAYTAPFEPGSTEERQPGPTINVRSFTSIGEIYGGGYGQTAVVTGDTYVNVNECVGDHDGEDTHTDANDAIKQISFTEYVRTADGGFELDGNGDKVTRNVTVDVFMPLHTPSTNDVKRIGAIHRIFGGGNAANVDGNTHVKIGTLSQTTFVTPKTASETDRTKAVVGADIRDNVYGGGNQADVTGDTEVIIGQEGQGD